jgi:hypothetical protein
LNADPAWPPRVGGAVVLVVRIAGAADHGAHAALAVQRHQRRLAHARLAVGLEHAAHGGFRRGLDRQVQRGLDDQVLLGIAHEGADLGVDPVDEIVGVLVGQTLGHLDRL